MENWKRALPYDPLPALLGCGNPGIDYFSHRDLLEENTGPPDELWELPAVQKILRKQREDGGWKYPGAKRDQRSSENYNQIETYRQLGELVEKYALDRRHPSVIKAAEYLFRFQTPVGDFRGIYGSQYSPNYSAGIMEILIKAGYQDDPRIEAGFHWLLSNRLDDGGWAIAMRTLKTSWQESYMLTMPLEPDRGKPFSHMVTGVVIRAFAAHTTWQHSPEARHAGRLLLSRFFVRDKYVDRREISYWKRVSFPFWFTDIVSGLDSVTLLGFNRSNPQIQLALEWLFSIQAEDGGFDLKLLKTRDKDTRWWVTLAVCRVVRRVMNSLIRCRN